MAETMSTWQEYSCLNLIVAIALTNVRLAYIALRRKAWFPNVCRRSRNVYWHIAELSSGV